MQATLLNRSLKYLVVILSTGTLSGTVVTYSHEQYENSSKEFNVADFASSAPSGRTLELGKVVPTKSNLKKEVKVLLKDPAMSEKWGLKLTDSTRAWKVSQGSKDIVVAVIDTGADTNHKDLKKNLWVNKGEMGKDIHGNDKATNGIDDDRNGYVDDIHGFNFVGNNHDLTDHHGHGTHIAGIIGAEGGNGVGISGVAPNVSLMILKYYDPKAEGVNNLMNTVKAIDYAVKNNAHIINYSGGGLEPSPQEKAAIKRAEKKGILVVAAAGNERSNSDVHGYYPADYKMKNIISVTAINKSRKVLKSSNWGKNSVDLAAPGNNIFSLLPKGQYGYMTGTSQATAFVTGVAALVMAEDKELRDAEKIHKYLTQTGDIDMNLAGKTRYNKRLNAFKALAIKDSDYSWNGSRAQNTVNIKASTFSSEPGVALSNIGSENSASPEGHFASQTRNILKYLSTDKKTQEAIRQPVGDRVTAPSQL